MIKAICGSPSARLPALMPVPMMHVRYVPMNVPQPTMPVPMRVRFARRFFRCVDMLMMFIMSVRMRMIHWLMNVTVIVALREVKPHPEPHQQACDNQLQSDRFAKPQYGRNCSEQGCGCKICRSTRRPEIAESNNEQR